MHVMRMSCVIAIASLLLATGAARASQTTLADVEDEVMCVQCKTPLNLSNAPAAERERAYIRREIAKGRSKEEIKAGLVAQFGPRVLAVPEDEGFGLAGWLVPVAVALAALAAVLLAARRWRKAGDADDAEAPDDAEEPDDAAAWRLDRELSVFDKRGRA